MSSKHLAQVTAATFDEVVWKRSQKLPVLVDFTADWCSPCQAMLPQLEAFAAAYAGRIVVVTCDVEAEGQLSQIHDVSALPCLILFYQGQRRLTMYNTRTVAEITRDVAGYL